MINHLFFSSSESITKAASSSRSPSLSTTLDVNPSWKCWALRSLCDGFETTVSFPLTGSFVMPSEGLRMTNRSEGIRLIMKLCK